MLIEEQIKIARLIASGTPREDAINEVAPTSSIEKSGQTIDVDAEPVQDRAKSRLDKIRQAARIARKKTQRGISKGGAIVKSAAGKLAKKDDKLKAPTASDVSGKPEEKPTTNVTVNIPADKEKGGYQKIDSSEAGATAAKKAVGNFAKLGARGVKKLAGIRLRKEEFIQEVEDNKDTKKKKVIDIMKGKNSVKINPDMKEDTVVVQDASGKDSVEIVDIISSQKIRSDWRKEINVTEASAAWQRKEGKSKSGGLNEKGRKSYERQNPGSDLKAPSKKVGNKRRASFCARMKGMKKKLTSAKTARDPNSRINKSLRAWNC
jgi:acyl carrier protein